MGLRVLTCGFAAAALSVAGCSATGTTGTTPSGRQATTSNPAPGSPSTASPADLARKQASAAYVGMWRDVAEAAKTSDWRSPILSRHATGDALSVISRSMYADHRNGLVAKGAPKTYPKAISADPSAGPTTVMISDCGDSTNWLKYRKDTGELADDTPGGRRAITAEVKKAAGGWKVARFAVEAVGSC
ncbi:hypothetical protein [Streptomyces roseirectus]|uniref:hypothetical protein n=1 Tax=Streptomyces roseirectus TaxID=2768066 RepID=UPI001CA609E2|nr:hypothetical protein [Streptomyces roseirectus]